MPSRRRVALPLGVLALAVVCGLTPAARAQSKRPMLLVDLLNIPRVLDPQMSPDGRRITFMLRTADWPANRRVDQIWTIGADGGGLKQLTNAEGGVFPGPNARWSPDGATLAYLARGADPGYDVFLMSPDGDAARQLSHHPTSVSDVAWAPDGASIYFIASESPTDADKAREAHRDDFIRYDEFRQQHLWKIGVSDGVEQRITGGDYSILSVRVGATGDLLVLRAPNPTVPDADLREVWRMNADGSGAVQLTNNAFEEADASLSPDGSQVIFLGRANDRQEPYYNANLFLMPSAGGTPRAVIPDFPHEVLRAEWAADGKSIWMIANMGVHSEIFQLDLATREARQVTDGAHSIPQWNPSGPRQVFAVDEATRFGDIWTFDAGAAAPRRVTGVYDYLDRDFLLPRQERIEWKGADGARVEGILFYPLDYAPGTRAPLVVQMHGGPEDSDKFSFGPVVWQGFQQVLTARGYAVLRPNYRGSSGYGNAAYRDVVGGFFRNNYLDVLAGVDQVIAMGVADPDKLVVMGYSAGGHLTNKLITVTDRFKAASAGAGASDWVSMYGLTDTRSDRDLWFGGSLWQRDAPIATYWDHSPLKDAWKVRTPTLFFVGERDARVPVAQSLEMFRALKAQGVPTRIDVAPLEGHTWVRPRNQLHKMNAEIEWFDRYALERTYTFEPAPTANDLGVIPKP